MTPADKPDLPTLPGNTGHVYTMEALVSAAGSQGHVMPDARQPAASSLFSEAQMRAHSTRADKIDFGRANGWHTATPTPLEADQLAQIHRQVVRLLDVDASYLNGPAVLDRYGQLMEIKRPEEARSATAA